MNDFQKPYHYLITKEEELLIEETLSELSQTYMISFDHNHHIDLKTFETFGISYELFKEFYISSIEIGINFNVQENAFPILNSALMFGRNYFVTHHKFKHYRFAGDSGKGKYLITKFYMINF